MKQAEKEYFDKISGAIDKIEKFIEPVQSASQLEKEEMISDAVILNLIVIADMVGKISDETKLQYDKVTWKQVKHVEHNLTNNYAGINISYIWQIVSEYIPIFKRQLSSVK